MSALMIARITIKDPQKFQDYLVGSKRLAGAHGAELLYRCKVSRVLNGDSDHEIVVIAKFPDKSDLNAWFDSDDYKPLARLRDEGTVMHMTSYEIAD